jgi:molybdenum cofactor cytidylyltransferase
VLAAGRGERLGGPKALLVWPLDDGRELPLAAAHAVVRLAAESTRVLVVVREPVAAMLEGWLPPGAELVGSHAAEELGPAGSLAAAVAALGELDPEQPVLVTPVDCPPVTASTVAALIATLATAAAPRAVRPRFQGRGGHPVALRAAALARYRSGEPPILRQLLAELGSRLVELAVDDPAVRYDLDRPDDLRALGRPEPRFVLSPRDR